MQYSRLEALVARKWLGPVGGVLVLAVPAARVTVVPAVVAAAAAAVAAPPAVVPAPILVRAVVPSVVPSGNRKEQCMKTWTSHFHNLFSQVQREKENKKPMLSCDVHLETPK